MNAENKKKIDDWLEFMDSRSESSLLELLPKDLQPLYGALFTYLKYQNGETIRRITCGICLLAKQGCRSCLYFKRYGHSCSEPGEPMMLWVNAGGPYPGPEWEAIRERAREIYGGELAKAGLLANESISEHGV